MGPVTESQSSEWFNLLFALLFLFVGYAICIAHVATVDTAAAVVLVSQMVTLVLAFVLLAVVLGLLSGSGIISCRYLSECLKDYTASKDGRRSPLQSTSNSPMVNFLDSLPATPTTGRVLANGTRIEGEGRNIWTANRNSLGSMPSLVGNMSPNTTATACPSPITPLSGNSPLNTPLTIESPVGSPSLLDDSDPLTRVRKVKNMLIEHTAKVTRRRLEHARLLREIEGLADAEDVPSPSLGLGTAQEPSPALASPLSTPLSTSRPLADTALVARFNGAVMLVANSGCDYAAAGCSLVALIFWLLFTAVEFVLDARSAYNYYSFGRNGGISRFVQDTILDVLKRFVLARPAKRSTGPFYSGYHGNAVTKWTNIVRFAKSRLEEDTVSGLANDGEVGNALDDTVVDVAQKEVAPTPVKTRSRSAAPVLGLGYRDCYSREQSSVQEAPLISSLAVNYTFEDLVSQLAYGMEEETFEVYDDWAHAVDVLFGDDSDRDTPSPSCESVSEEGEDEEIEEAVDSVMEQEVAPGRVETRFFEDSSASVMDLSIISFNSEGSGAPTWEDSGIAAQRRFAKAWAAGSLTNLSRGVAGTTTARVGGRATSYGEDMTLVPPMSLPSKVFGVVVDLESENAADGNKQSPRAAACSKITGPPKGQPGLGRELWRSAGADDCGGLTRPLQPVSSPGAV